MFLYILFSVNLYFRTIGLGVKGTRGGLGSQSEHSWVWTKLVSHANMAVDTWALRQPACPGSEKGGAGSNPASSIQYFSFFFGGEMRATPPDVESTTAMGHLLRRDIRLEKPLANRPLHVGSSTGNAVPQTKLSHEHMDGIHGAGLLSWVARSAH